MPKQHLIPAPSLENNPSWDVIITQLTPLLSFFNAKGGPKRRHYEIELSTSRKFPVKGKIKYLKVKENGEFVTDKKVEDEEALRDKREYYWRVRTVTAYGKSAWAVSRFYVDTQSDAPFMNMTRIRIKKVTANAGYNVKNIIDWDDPGQITFWQSPPPGPKEQWLIFDLGRPVEVCRAWMLSNPDNPDGWLQDFVWQSSSNGKKWREVKGGKVNKNDSFRNILDFKPTKARYFRLLIKSFIGYAAQLNEVILYSPGKPRVPNVPKGDYVLVIGNEHNGFTFTELAADIESLPLKLKTVVVPYYEASMEMVEKLKNKPVAIVLSGNNADYPKLPMFEHNGEFEIIRESNIPMLGICAGHQFMAMAYGFTRARSMGWSDISAMEPETRMTRVKIRKKDPIFKNIRNNFIAPEIHGWAVVDPAPGFQVIAASKYIQAQRNTKRLMYGAQFHAEIHVPYNHGRPYIENFLRMAIAWRKEFIENCNRC